MTENNTNTAGKIIRNLTKQYREIYVVRFSDGSYYWEYPTQICYSAEDAKAMTLEDAKDLCKKFTELGKKVEIVDLENNETQTKPNKIKAKLTVEVEAEFYDYESDEETVRYCFEQDLEDAGVDVIDVSVDNTLKNLRVKIEQLVEDFENSIGNRNMNDLEQGKYDGYRDILDLLDEME